MKRIPVKYLILAAIAILLLALVTQSPPQTTLEVFQDTENYQIEKVLDDACNLDSDCQTPFEYQIDSRCPFTTKCLENKCTLICPEF
jgi:hypothetical protein